ncbi:hypothetical protein OS493_019389 [Desmophyllum pertusum]|uniref:Uncharacterized protein n=1 Tax=Desmophyllum pertusum TaxID=174260 RepID=A0A9X0DA61_9CNID|nr:hypothetical protein OS493_019389 [Desmophyllum pertusum]
MCDDSDELTAESGPLSDTDQSQQEDDEGFVEEQNDRTVASVDAMLATETDSADTADADCEGPDIVDVDASTSSNSYCDLQMSFGGSCCCSKHQEWHHSPDVAKKTFALRPFTKKDNGPHYHNTGFLLYLAEVNDAFNLSLVEYNIFEADPLLSQCHATVAKVAKVSKSKAKVSTKIAKVSTEKAKKKEKPKGKILEVESLTKENYVIESDDSSYSDDEDGPLANALQSPFSRSAVQFQLVGWRTCGWQRTITTSSRRSPSPLRWLFV